MNIADSTFDCHPGTCAVASVGLPFVSEVVEASPEKPYISVELMLDAGIVAGLLLDMSKSTQPYPQAGAISIAQADSSFVEPLVRFIGLLDTPAEVKVLGSQFEREFYYRLLLSPLGSRLCQIGMPPFAAIVTTPITVKRSARQRPKSNVGTMPIIVALEPMPTALVANASVTISKYERTVSMNWCGSRLLSCSPTLEG